MRQHSTRRTQAKRSQRMRQRLIDATITCLAEKGYAKTTIGRIVAHAGVSHGATGHHFHSKAALITAATEEMTRRIQRIQTDLMNELTPGAGFTAWAEGVWSRLHATPLIRAVLELSISARREQDLTKALQGLFSEVVDGFRTEALQEARQSFGNAGLVAGIIPLTTSLMLGMAIQYNSRGETPELAEQLDLWAQLVEPHVSPQKSLDSRSAGFQSG